MNLTDIKETIKSKNLHFKEESDFKKYKMSNNFSVERILSENTQSVNHQPITSEFSNKFLGTIVDRKRRLLEKSIKDITNSDAAKHPRITSSEKVDFQGKL